MFGKLARQFAQLKQNETDDTVEVEDSTTEDDSEKYLDLAETLMRNADKLDIIQSCMD